MPSGGFSHRYVTLFFVVLSSIEHVTCVYSACSFVSSCFVLAPQAISDVFGSNRSKRNDETARDQ